MKKKVFYSWQSDLPGKENRNLISECLGKAIKKVARDNLDLDPVLDRDTQGIGGSPEIVSTIFFKIDQAHVFVADISIINKGSKFRKTPNPNVLIELGYAAHILGWDNIITVFNTDTGKLEDLPFDIRARRPLQYSGQNRKEDKVPLQESLQTAIDTVLDKSTPTETVRNHIKSKMDMLIVEGYNHIYKLCKGYEHEGFEIYRYTLMNWRSKELTECLYEKKLLGFFLFKDYDYIADELEHIFFLPSFTLLFNIKVQQVVVKLIQALHDLQHFSRTEGLFQVWGQAKEGRFVDGSKYYPNTTRKAVALQMPNPRQVGSMANVDWGIISPFIRSSDLHNYYRPGNDRFPTYIDCLADVLQAMDTYQAMLGILVDPAYISHFGMDTD